jgi:hypothetical protein
MKIRSVGAEVFHVDRRKDGQTGMIKLIVSFRDFENAPKTATKPSTLVMTHTTQIWIAYITKYIRDTHTSLPISEF